MNCEINGQWNEREFRERCALEGDDLAILLCENRFTYTVEADLKTIRDYGWPGCEELFIENDSDRITRIAAEIRECGITDNYYDDQEEASLLYDWRLDEDGNYAEDADYFGEVA